MARSSYERRLGVGDGCAPRRVLTYDQALRRAIKLFVRDGGVDMKALADDFPVGRATLAPLQGAPAAIRAAAYVPSGEPETAFRVLLTPAGGVSERVVHAWVDILRGAVERGEVVLPFDVEWFAYVFVRTGESMVYFDLLAGREPDLKLAERIQRLLFRLAN